MKELVGLFLRPNAYIGKILVLELKLSNPHHTVKKLMLMLLVKDLLLLKQSWYALHLLINVQYLFDSAISADVIDNTSSGLHFTHCQY